MLRKSSNGIQPSEHMDGESDPEMYRHAGAVGLEGIVSHRVSHGSRKLDSGSLPTARGMELDLARVELHPLCRASGQVGYPPGAPFGAQPVAGAVYTSIRFQSGQGRPQVPSKAKKKNGSDAQPECEFSSVELI